MICRGLLHWRNGEAGSARYPEIACGLKRGFTFFHQEDELLVAASPHDDIADTHWYRADVDHFLVREAQRLGVEYRESVRIETLEFDEDGATIVGRAGEEAFHLHAGLLIDATGPRGFLHRSLRLEESPLPGVPPHRKPVQPLHGSCAHRNCRRCTSLSGG